MIDPAKTIAETAGVSSGGLFLFGVSMAQVNEYLTAASLIVGMIGVGIASYYYLKAAKRK